MLYFKCHPVCVGYTYVPTGVNPLPEQMTIRPTIVENEGKVNACPKLTAATATGYCANGYDSVCVDTISLETQTRYLGP